MNSKGWFFSLMKKWKSYVLQQYTKLFEKPKVTHRAWLACILQNMASILQILETKYFSPTFFHICLQKSTLTLCHKKYSPVTSNWAWNGMNSILAYVSYMSNKLAFVIFLGVGWGKMVIVFENQTLLENLTFQSTNTPFNLQEK